MANLAKIAMEQQMAKDMATKPSEFQGPLPGGSGGVADAIPAVIEETGEPAALSAGEFVMPADVVSFLGDGDSNSGAAMLQKIIDDVRGQMEGPRGISAVDSGEV